MYVFLLYAVKKLGLLWTIGSTTLLTWSEPVSDVQRNTDSLLSYIKTSSIICFSVVDVKYPKQILLYRTLLLIRQSKRNKMLQPIRCSFYSIANGNLPSLLQSRCCQGYRDNNNMFFYLLTILETIISFSLFTELELLTYCVLLKFLSLYMFSNFESWKKLLSIVSCKHSVS